MQTAAILLSLPAVALAEEGKAAHVDALGDALPPGTVARLGTLRLRPRCWFPGTDFSPDGKLLACVGEGRHVRLWDTDSGKEVPRISPAPTGPVLKVKFSPTGQILAGKACGEVPELFLWETATGKLLHRLQGREIDALLDMAFADRGKTVLGVNKAGTVCWWRAADGTKLRTWDLKGSIEKPPGSWHFGQLRGASLRPDGHVLAALVLWMSAEEDVPVKKQFRLTLWDLDRRKELWQLERDSYDIHAFDLSADGKVVAVGVGGADVSLRDGLTGRELRRLEGGEGDHLCDESLALSPDGKLLAAVGRGPSGVRVWDTGSGKVVHRLGCATAPDLFEPRCHPLFSPDGKRLLFPWDKTLALWDLDTWSERPRLPGHRDAVHFLTFSEDGKRLLSGSESAKPQWPCPRETITWDTASWRAVAHAQDRRQQRCFFSPRGRIVIQALTSSDELALVDGATGKRRGTLPEAATQVCLAFAPDERTLAWVDAEAVIHVVAVDGARELCRLGKPRQEWAQKRAWAILAFSPAGLQLAFWERDSRAIVLWDWRSGREIGRMQGRESLTGIAALAYSPDGRMLAVGVDHSDEVELWEVASGQRRRRVPGHGWPVSALAFSPDGRLLASGSWDTTVLVWDLHRLSPRDGPAENPARPEALWAGLAHADAGQAHEAMTALLEQPATAARLLGQKLRPAPYVGVEIITRAIVELDSDDFDRRERAMHALEDWAEQAEPALRKSLRDQPALEVRRRIERLLEELHRPPPQRLRLLRAVEVLEQLRTPQAQEVLKRLAGGAADARLTREARASLQRLEHMPAGRP